MALPYSNRIEMVPRWELYCAAPELNASRLGPFLHLFPYISHINISFLLCVCNILLTLSLSVTDEINFMGKRLSRLTNWLTYYYGSPLMSFSLDMGVDLSIG